MKLKRDAWFQIGTVLFFAVSALAVAMRRNHEMPVWNAPGDMLSGRYGRSMNSAPILWDEHLIGIIQNPVNWALTSLLVAVIASSVLYLALRWRSNFSPPMPLLTMLGLIASGIWPWVAPTSPAAALVIATLAPVGVVAGILQRRRSQHREPGDWPLGLIAGWLTMGGIGAASGLAQMELSLRPELAALAGLLAASLIGARVQLELGSNVTYAAAIIWAMLGIAAASLAVSMTVATACVLGIATMAVVLVRVTT
ncbi:hypothetical protein [uncultured Paracoccus sp.]|uniref:hypothetical protein n=1 Tax=uncultured Paracoccus sp. TaxID=189685 RepID=UPI0026107C23|nr:hypothetical protein [uncultured Paracoccus sp.]